MDVDVLDLVEYLTSKGLQVHRAAGPEVTVHCIFCPDGDPKGKGKLYLNTESWLYDCKRCGANGNRTNLLDHFGDRDKIAYTNGADPAVRRRILAEVADLAHEMLLANETQLSYLLGRGLSPETIMEAKLGYIPANVGISRMIPSAEHVSKRDLVSAGVLTVSGREFFSDSLTIPYFSHGSVIQIREKKPDGKYRTTGGDHARLYGADDLRAAHDVIVTEGEFDKLITTQHLRAANDPMLRMTAVVALPGAGSWPDNVETYFSTAHRVFLGLDPDDTGRTYAAKLKALLGSKARILDLPRALPKCDWTEYLRDRDDAHPHGGHTWRDVHALLVDADLAGKRMFSVPETRAKWGKRRDEQPGLKLGFPSLDAVIRPGVKPGQIVIPLAKTGTGKSVFLSNVVHNNHTRRVLYVSLELTAAEIYEHLRRIHHFWYPAGADQMDADYAKIRVVDQNRLGSGDLATLVGEYTEELGNAPELVIIDYLQYFARGFRGSSAYEKVSDATMELKALAKEHDLGMVIPSQVNRDAKQGHPLDADDARDSGVIEETADFLLTLFRPDTAVMRDDGQQAVTGAFNVGLPKSRHGGAGRVFNLRFSNLSLAIVDALDRKNVARVSQENNLYAQGVHYDDWREQNRPDPQLRLA